MADSEEKVQKENTLNETMYTNNITNSESSDTVSNLENTPKETTTVKEENYPIKEFIDNSEALGYRKEVVAGALFNCEKTEFTKTEFEIMIKKFLGKKVK